MFPRDFAASPTALDIPNQHAQHLAERQVGVTRTGKGVAESAGNNQRFILFLGIPGKFSQKAGFAPAGLTGDETDAPVAAQRFLQPTVQASQFDFAGDKSSRFGFRFGSIQESRLARLVKGGDW